MKRESLSKHLFNIIYNYVKENDYVEFTFTEPYFSGYFYKEENTDNISDHSNEGYEQCLNLLFESKDDDEDEFFTLNYHNIPEYILVDDKIIFNKKVEAKKYLNLVSTQVFTISFDLFNIEFEDEDFFVETGIEFLDTDEKFTNIFLKLRNLLKAPYKEINGHSFFDNKLYMKLEKEVKDLYLKLLERINELNDGSIIVEDCFEPNYEMNTNKTPELGFSEDDLILIKNEKSNSLLNRGAKYYTRGEYEKAFPYTFAAALMGNPSALNNLGYNYMYGRNGENNMDFAITCFMIAANKGVVESNYKLGTIYKYDKKYKNLELSKFYFLRAVEFMGYEESFMDNPSLAFSLAKEKISGEILTKDILGAYLLLKLAYNGYDFNVTNGFIPHQKQFNEVKDLLNDEIFNDAKLFYRENLEFSYIFGDYELSLEDYKDENNIVMGDEAIVIVDSNYDHSSKDYKLKIGDKVYVSGVIFDMFEVQLDNGEEFYIKRDAVRKAMKRFSC